MTPQEFLIQLNENGSDFVDGVISDAGYQTELSNVLPQDASDFFYRFENDLYFFSVETSGEFSMTYIESKPVYFWSVEYIGGDATEVDADKLEAELSHSMPGVFVRQDSVAPGANENDFYALFASDIDRVWREALEVALG